MLDLNNPTIEQPKYILGETGSNAINRKESGVLEGSTAKVAQAVAVGTNKSRIKVPTAVSDVMLGVIISYHENAVFLPQTEYEFQIDDDVTFMRWGDIIVAPLVPVSKGDPMYVETAAGANRGYFTNVASASTVTIGTFEETTTAAGELCRAFVNCL